MRRERKRILDAEGLRRALSRIAHEILERHGGTADLVLVGMRSRGVPIARRLADLDRKSTRLNSSHSQQSRMPSSA